MARWQFISGKIKECIWNLIHWQNVLTNFYKPLSLTNYNTTFSIYSPQWHHFLQTLHRGTTVLYLDVETHQVALVFLKLERCSGTLTWCRPPWKDPRKGLSTDPLASTYSLDTMETAVSPGLRLKYTNRSGESLAYQVGFQNKQYTGNCFSETLNSYVN